MSMKKIKVSIITVSLNQGRYIEKCIKSVKEQTYPYIEHIIMDGGSADNTLEILKKYNGTYNIIWRSKKDRGQSHAFNKAIKIAKGDWLIFINSDDFLLKKTSIDDALRLIKKNPGHMIYMANIKVVDANNHYCYDGSEFKHKIYTYDILMNKDPHVVHQGTIYNKKVFKKIGFYDERFNYHMDYELHLRASRFFDIQTLNMFLSALRTHPQAKTKKWSPKSDIEIIYAKIKNGGSLINKQNFYSLIKFIYRIFSSFLKRKAYKPT